MLASSSKLSAETPSSRSFSFRESLEDDGPSARFSTFSSSEITLSSRFSSSRSSESRSSLKLQTSHACTGTISTHEGAVYCLAIPQGDHFFSGSADGQVLVWKQQNYLDPDSSGISPVCRFGRGDGSVKALLSVRQKDLVFTAHQDHRIRVWRSSAATSQEHPEHFKLLATLPTVANCARHCLLPSSYIRVRRHKTCLWIQHSDAISCLAYAKSERGVGLIYSCSWDRTVKVWRVSDLRCLHSFKAHDDAINVVIAHQGYIYTGSADSKIKVWSAFSFLDKKQRSKHVLISVLSDMRVQASSVNALTFSADGGLLFAGMSDSTIATWERKLDESCHMSLLGRLKGHRRSVLCLAVTREVLCSGSADMTVRLWRRGCCLGVLKGHTGPVKCVAAAVEGTSTSDAVPHPDSSSDDEGSQSEETFRVYSGSLDKKIRIWRVRVCRNESGTASEAEELGPGTMMTPTHYKYKWANETETGSL